MLKVVIFSILPYVDYTSRGRGGRGSPKSYWVSAAVKGAVFRQFSLGYWI